MANRRLVTLLTGLFKRNFETVPLRSCDYLAAAWTLPNQATEPSMAGLIDRFLGKIFKGSATGDSKRKKLCHNIRFNENPEDYWTIVGDLGDGAFGKVHKVCFSFYYYCYYCFINHLT